MLNARNLDDQSYEEIIKAAVGRLPWLCPQWTDHNAHDPGITILELLAWYKEMQQYQMNQLTDELRWKLLKLVGVTRRPATPALCAVEAKAQDLPRLAGSRLRTGEGVPFELLEEIPAHRPEIARICLRQRDRLVDVSQMLGRVTFLPFDTGEDGRSELCVGFSGWETGELRLWFDVEPPEGVTRNPFTERAQAPRSIRWTCQGASGTRVWDDTHALSQSGYVRLEPEGTWPAGAEDGLRWLVLTLEDPGCEEQVRLAGISAGRYQAVQRETWARSYRFRAEARPDWEAELDGVQTMDADLAVFLRDRDGWAQTDLWQSSAVEGRRRVRVDAGAAVQDGEENVMILSLDPLHEYSMMFDAKGLPGETFHLDLEGRTVLTDSFALLCETLDRDGKVRPMLWRCVEDFYQYGPRDRVFTFDQVRETITFGDGAHGALLQRGKGAVLAADLTLSYCGGGNIPGGRELCFEADGAPIAYVAAAGGADRESVQEAQARFLRQLSVSRKCVCAGDYERLARETPGLRVAAAKALPAYDPEEPTGVSRIPTVTVVVVPAGAGERPLPDERFLELVRRQLERYRPVNTQVRVVAPVYLDAELSVAFQAGETGVEDAVRESVTAYLKEAGIGGAVRGDDIQARLQAVPGMPRIREVKLRIPSPGCRKNGDGGIELPRRAIPCLNKLQLKWER